LGRAYSKKLKDQQRKVEYDYRTRKNLTLQKDAIRGIIKDLNQRDLLTGEIIYRRENEFAIKQALACGTYTVEVPAFESKHLLKSPEKTVLPLDQSLVNQVVKYEYGEVLNRAIEPCWWR
jgi:hypothetical protein